MADKKADVKPEAQAAPQAEGTPRKKKINELTLAEIESRLADCQEKQGGLYSKYAIKLQARKKALSVRG